MSTYETLKGLKVKFLGADTSSDRVQEGELFYNSVSYQLKSHIAVGAWSTGSAVSVGRYSVGNFGTKDANVIVGGTYSASANPAYVLSSEEYNGSGWSAGGNYPTVIQGLGGAGTQTAGLGFGGYIGPVSALTNTYNGTTWTAANHNMNTARNGIINSGTGTATAALACGGTPNAANTEEYDGSSWANGGNLNTGRNGLAALGTQTAAMATGGEPALAVTEEYNGTSWSEVNNIGTGRHFLAKSGIQTSGLVFGGASATALTVLTESYDGTTFTVQGALGTAQSEGGGSNEGSSNEAISTAGRNP